MLLPKERLHGHLVGGIVHRGRGPALPPGPLAQAKKSEGLPVHLFEHQGEAFTGSKVRSDPSSTRSG